MEQTKEYIEQMQEIVEYWKSKIDILYFWNITFVFDGEHWSHTVYSVKDKKAIIYACDISDENAYILHEILKIAFIASEGSMDSKLSLITDICSMVQRD